MDHRWRQYLNRVRTAITQGSTGRDSDASRAALADRRGRSHGSDHRQTVEVLVGKLGKPGQWGIPYNKGLEIGSAPMKAGKTSKPVEQMTISIDDTPGGGTLRVEWGGTSASIPFTVG